MPVDFAFYVLTPLYAAQMVYLLVQLIWWRE